MSFGGRQPLAYVTLVGAIVLAIVQTLLGQGFISDVVAGKLTNAVTTLSDLAPFIIWIISNAFAHRAVTPIGNPVLPVGTSVNGGSAQVVATAQPPLVPAAPPTS